MLSILLPHLRSIDEVLPYAIGCERALLAAGVPFTRWIRFVFGAVLLTALVGVIAIAAVVWLQLM